MSTVDRFTELSDLLQRAAPLIADSVDRASELMLQCLDGGGKILICGNGGSASHAQHLASELVGRFQIEREGRAAISLTADSTVLTSISNDYAYQDVFARQVKALGVPGDVLVAITTSGKSLNIAVAIAAANRRSMPVILLTGEKYSMPLEADDVAIAVPSHVTARIQEVHQVIVHCLCERIDAAHGFTRDE